MKSLSLSSKRNLTICFVTLVAIALIIYLVFKPSQKPCQRPPQNQIVVPIGGGKSVALTQEQYQKLKQEGFKYKKEGFYVSPSEYIPNVRTENEYTPMLSLYQPKEQSRVVPEPVPAPTPAPVMPSATGSNGPVEGYGNVFIDNFIAPTADPVAEKYREELTKLSPFFLNNGQIANGQMI
jgi:hypothetical protein